MSKPDKRAYTLKEKEKTEELHLFEGDFSKTPCTSKQLSICKKMSKNESIANKFTCEEEDIARTVCAKIGRVVCGICVSHLYSTYK